ncbi:hypothetical protein [Parasegetibacter sp. NRK P23]|uniref:hypothetical protein n=1 Tax=Parasegetibacter sp. NRK P23 TaxID=2942999 RepID=UPI0020434E85|nr:hypothetical protein [Parasegetibacter sp. NRK P23]MCM5529846.1 hypothetical protein [Parasegetibacter sp. NRK P23]
MRILGVILLIAGIAMIVFREVNFTTEKEVADLGPVEINKKENKTIGWPSYAGGITAVAGIVLLVAGGKRKS